MLSAALLSGCAWQGDGKQVADALEKSIAAKSHTFNGSITVSFPQGALPQGAKNGAPGQMLMSFEGKAEASDPAKPSSEFKLRMTADGKQQLDITTASVGNDMYLTTGGKSYTFPMTAEQRALQTMDPSKIYAALADAVGDFEKSQPMQGANGPVPTTAARIDRKKLCGPVFDAFGDIFKSMKLDGGMSAPTGDGKPIDTGKIFRTMCVSMLQSDPKLWFGIQNGVLTDIAMEADLNVPMAGAMKISVQYHETNIGQPVEVVVPAGAQRVESMQQILSQLMPPRA